MRDHSKGLLITLVGALILGPDTVIIRLADEGRWTVLAWRGAMMLIGFLLLARWLQPGATKQSLGQQFRQMRWVELALALCFAGSSFCFITAVHFTTIANTLVIISVVPLIAAIFSWWFFREGISRAALVAIALVVLGVSLVVQDGQQGHWQGDLAAFGSSVLIALTFVISRSTKNLQRFPAMAISGAIVLFAALFFTDPLVVKPESVKYLLMLGLITTTAFALLVVGPRYIPAHEVSMLMPLETVFGVGLAWWVLAEVPSGQTLAGGLLVLITLAVYGWYRSREK